METADSLRIKFGCKDDAELGALFGRSGGVVSVWRKKGLPPAIEKRAYELMQERGIPPEAATVYGVTSVHRNLTPDQETVLEALEGDPLAQLFILDMLKLEGDDLAQAYADFRKRWKGKNTGDQQ